MLGFTCPRTLNDLITKEENTMSESKLTLEKTNEELEKIKQVLADRNITVVLDKPLSDILKLIPEGKELHFTDARLSGDLLSCAIGFTFVCRDPELVSAEEPHFTGNVEVLGSVANDQSYLDHDNTN